MMFKSEKLDETHSSTVLRISTNEDGELAMKI